MNSNSAVHLGLWRGSGKRLLLKALLLLGAVVFAVTLTESFLVYKGLYPPPPNPIKKTAEIYEEYPPHGYRLKPNISRTVIFVPGVSGRTADARELIIESNKNGFRGRRELDEADDRTRIAVLGDSFVFGSGVAQPERFTDVLERVGKKNAFIPGDTHLNAFGHQVLARELQGLLLRLKERHLFEAVDARPAPSREAAKSSPVPERREQ